MKTAIYPGSFDPITKGHLDIIERASMVFDEIIVGVLVNPDKKGLLNLVERVELIKRVTKKYSNVKVENCTGLLVNFMKEKDINIIIKGLRSVTDFEYEIQMEMINKKLDPTVETVFMMANSEYTYLSSSAVKQVAIFGGDICQMVPDEIVDDVLGKINK